MKSQLEIERKFAAINDVSCDFSTIELPGVGTLQAGAPTTVELHAVYFDTPQLQLLQHRISLRRRSGGDDEGWHLKQPVGDQRREHHHPLTDSSLLVPDPLRLLIAEEVDSQPLLPVAEITTRRRHTPYILDGRVVALLCDDHVSSHGPHGADQWREIEVELVVDDDSDQSILDAMSTALLAVDGITPASSASKIAHVLSRPPAAVQWQPTTSAATIVGSYLADQIGALQQRSLGLADDQPGAVHKSRVALRRMRSTLRVFRCLFRADVTEPLRAELQWLASCLGPARDTEVLLTRLTTAAEQHLATIPADQLGPILEVLPSALQERHRDAHRVVRQTLLSPRYRAICEALVRFLTDPPWRPIAQRSADDVLRAPLARAAHRVDRARAAADRATTQTERASAWHEVRKKAKAMRYACEALAPAFPAAAHQAVLWEQATEELGLAQDAAVSRQLLVELAAAAASRGEPTFGYGVLFGCQQHTHAAAALEQARAADLW